MRKYLITILIAGYSIIASGQPTNFKTELYMGATGGMTFTKVRFYPNIAESFYQGYSGGFLFRLISEPHIGFQAEINYTQKGWKEDSVGYARRITYVNIPIMTHINIGKKAVRFTLNLGPEVAFKISEKEQFKDPGLIEPSNPGYRDIFGKPVDNSMDLLFTVGIGMEYHLKSGSAIALEGRGFYSLPNLFDKNKYIYNISQGNGVQVKLAYLFKLGKKDKNSKVKELKVLK